MTAPSASSSSRTLGDNLNRLTNLAATKTSTNTPITNFGYQYDAAGNRTQKSTLDYTEDYGYDPLYRLTRADRTNPGATPPNQWTWSYDAVGNRTSAQKDSEATTSTHNEKNQLLGTSGGGRMLWRGVLDEPGLATFSASQASINGQPARMLAGNVFEATLDLPAGANTVVIQAQDGSGNVASKSYSVNVTGGNATYTYDANGNLATKTEGADAWVYTWNALNQLTAVSKNGASQATYHYDPLGRRVSRELFSPTSWTYSGKDVVRQGASDGVRLVIVGEGVDEPLATERAAVTSYLHADALGSIVSKTSAQGGLVETTALDPWGLGSSATPDDYGFTGRDLDAATGLLYLRLRYYDPKVGRFVSEDPAGFIDGVNLYRFVGNTPTRWIDPFGLARCSSSNRASCNLKPATWDSLDCFDECLFPIDRSCGTDHYRPPDYQVVITSGSDSHDPGTPHMRGEAVDLGKRVNPNVDRKSAETCFKKCFPKNAYAQEEYNKGCDPKQGTHYHFQMAGRAPGFAPGVVCNQRYP
jgi:RHS repeat-associated protein